VDVQDQVNPGLLLVVEPLDTGIPAGAPDADFDKAQLAVEVDTAASLFLTLSSE